MSPYCSDSRYSSYENVDNAWLFRTYCGLTAKEYPTFCSRHSFTLCTKQKFKICPLPTRIWTRFPITCITCSGYFDRWSTSSFTFCIACCELSSTCLVALTVSFSVCSELLKTKKMRLRSLDELRTRLKAFKFSMLGFKAIGKSFVTSSERNRIDIFSHFATFRV